MFEEDNYVDSSLFVGQWDLNLIIVYQHNRSAHFHRVDYIPSLMSIKEVVSWLNIHDEIGNYLIKYEQNEKCIT